MTERVKDLMFYDRWRYCEFSFLYIDRIAYKSFSQMNYKTASKLQIGEQ